MMSNASRERFGFGRLAHFDEHHGKIAEAIGISRMLLAEHGGIDGQLLLVHPLGIGEVAHFLTDHGQIVQGNGIGGMFFAE